MYLHKNKLKSVQIHVRYNSILTLKERHYFKRPKGYKFLKSSVPAYVFKTLDW